MGKGKSVISMQGVVVGLVSLAMLTEIGEATTFVVGGTKGWTCTSDSTAYNQWAQKMRFQTGDSLLFIYHTRDDSVLRVKKEDYNNCNTNSPLEKHTSGYTQIKLTQSGPHYFISGNKENCIKNEKLVVVVLSERTSSQPPPPTATTTDGAVPSSESNPPKSHAATVLAISSVGFIWAFLGSSLLMAF